MAIIDYAQHMQQTQAAIKAMHQSMLEKNYEDALEHSLTAMVELRLTYNSIRHEQETQVR